mmetsp:Transcript_2691/g.4019  ORF Transcript_2691/g.4019 Transcript_2691/m.4019 type:complete len:547 (-) Transcript_2691:771-2411(-)
MQDDSDSLDEMQLEKIERIKSLCTEREYFPDISSQGDYSSTKGTGKPILIPERLIDIYRLDFDIEFFDEPVLERNALQQIERLKNFQKKCRDFEEKLAHAMKLLESIGNSQKTVNDKTSSLHSTCEKLLAEQQSLQARADLLGRPLQYFAFLEEISRQLGMSISNFSDSENFVENQQPIRPGSSEFVEALERIGKCVEYLEKHSEFKDSVSYIVQYNQLKRRALALLKIQSIDFISQAAKMVNTDENNALSEVSSIFTKFRSISSKVCANVSILAAHANSPDLLKEIEAEYLEKRGALLKEPVKIYLENLHQERDSVAMIRASAAYFLKIGSLEAELFEQCFSYRKVNEGKSVERGAHLYSYDGLFQMLLNLCEEVYRQLRPYVLHDGNLDNLCEIALVIRDEILIDFDQRESAESIERGSQEANKEAVKTALMKLAHDCQERIIYLAQKVIYEEVLMYRTEGERLVEYHQAISEGSGSGSSDASFSLWYPPMKTGLLILSKIYRIVDMKVFKDIAGGTVSSLTGVLVAAGKYLVSLFSFYVWKCV